MSICADYFDNRIMTGKVFPDVYYLTVFLIKLLFKDTIRIYLAVYRSKPMQDILAFLHLVAKMLMVFSIIKFIVFVLRETINLWKKFYGELLALFTISTLITLFLLNLFTGQQLLFFVLFLPAELLNCLILAVVYCFINQKLKNDHTEFIPVLQSTMRQFVSVAALLIFYIFSIIELLTAFLLISALFSYYLESVGIAWISSFIFWIIVLILGLFTLTAMFLITLFTPQAYYLVLLEKKPFFMALRDSARIIKQHIAQFTGTYVFIFFYFIPVIFGAILLLYEHGFALTMLFLTQLIIFVNFILHRKYIVYCPNTVSMKYVGLFRTIFVVLLIIGIPAYIFFSMGTMTIYPQIVQSIMAQNQEKSLNKELTLYTNREAGYMIKYPKTWTIYNFEAGSVTLYNNYNGTENGGIWVTITVSPAADTFYDQLVQSKPGLVSYDPATQNVLTKVSDITINKHDGVKYTYTKHSDQNTEYQTHYLITRENLVYDLYFTTRSQDVEEFNSDLFNTMANSFHFPEDGAAGQ